MHFKPIDDSSYFVQTGGNQELADCAEFQLGCGRDGSDEIYFFVENPLLVDFLKRTSDRLYLYGAYNQINVCQMRVLGSVTSETDNPETAGIRERSRSRITERVGVMVHKLTEREAEDRYRLIDNGHMFCFRCQEYAYETYERG
ncbi:MAG: hypothetical protein Q8P23_00180 [bacterium]|nr:hypothetical protein [bacterium]